MTATTPSTSTELPPSTTKKIKRILERVRKSCDNNVPNQCYATLKEDLSAGRVPRSFKHSNADNKSKVATDDDDEDSDSDDDEDEDVSISTSTDTEHSYLKKILYLQIKYTQKSYAYAIKYFSKYGRSFIYKLIPKQQINMLVLFMLYSYLIQEHLLWKLISFCLLLFAFFEMVFITIREIHNEKGFNDFMEWSKFLKTVDEVLDVEEAKQKFANRKHPYIALADFITGLVIVVMSYSVAPSFVPIYLLGTVTLASFIFSSYSLGVMHQQYFLIALLLQILATALEGFNRMSIDYYHSVSFSLFRESFEPLGIIITVSSFIRVLSILFYIRHVRHQEGPKSMAVRSVVLVSVWWELLSMFSTSISLFSLVKYSTAIFATLIYLPFAAIIFLYSLSYYVVPLMTFGNVMCIVFIMLLISAYFFLSRHSSKLVKNKYGLAAVQGMQMGRALVTSLFNQIKILLKKPRFYVAIFTLAVLNGLLFFEPLGLQIQDSSLSFDNYYELCVDTHDSRNEAYSSFLCNRFKDHYVNWKGSVKQVELIEIENSARSFCNQLPGSLANQLTCLFGERYQYDTHDCSSDECLSAFHSQKPCHLEFYDRYSFEITVSMQSETMEGSADLKLFTEFGFGKRLMDIEIGSVVSFQGVLDPMNGTIALEQLTFEDCSDDCVITSQAVMFYTDITDRAHQAFINFFLHPFVIFT